MKKTQFLLISTLTVINSGCSYLGKKTQSLFFSNTVSHNFIFDSDSDSITPIETIHFAFNSSNLSKKTKRKLVTTAEFLKVNQKIRLEIEGHSDVRGGVQYNLALGDQRAENVKKYLINLGVDEDRLKTVSYGKERPVSIAYGHKSWARNRRVNFVVTNRDIFMARTSKNIQKSIENRKNKLPILTQKSSKKKYTFLTEYEIEPLIGTHQFGSLNINEGLNRNGYSLGGRLATKLPYHINLGLEYRIGEISLDRFVVGVNELSVNYLGVFLSYTKMQMFDLWGTWLFNIAEEYNNSNQSVLGKGIILGIGFKAKHYFKNWPDLKINLEFFRYDLTEYEDPAGNVSSISTLFGAERLAGSELILGVSYPIPL